MEAPWLSVSCSSYKDTEPSSSSEATHTLNSPLPERYPLTDFRTAISKNYHQTTISPNKPPAPVKRKSHIAFPIVSHPSPPLYQNKCQETQEHICQEIVSSFLNLGLSILLSASQITTSKIYWSPQAKFCICCTHFKLQSHTIFTFHQPETTNPTHFHTPLHF